MNAEQKKQVRLWFHKHGVEYIPDDWGDPRYHHGSGNARPTGGLPKDGQTHSLEYVQPYATPPWKQRVSELEREKIEALEEFFQPYIAQLPVAKGQVLYEYMFLRRTLEEVGGYRSKQAAHQALQRALQDLARIVAEDHGYAGPEDKRFRDKNAETREMKLALNRFWSERFGVPYVTGEETPLPGAPLPVRHADPNGMSRVVKEKDGGGRSYFQTYRREDHDKRFGGAAMPKCPTCGRWAWAGHDCSMADYAARV